MTRWTANTPRPLAFVPGLLHGVGAFYPHDGIGAIPQALANAAVAAGVIFDYGTRVTAIRNVGGWAAEVTTEHGQIHDADAVLSNAAGIGTYLHLLPDAPPALRTRLRRLPLQSPGVIAYLAVKSDLAPPYLRFFLPGGDERCRCLVTPGVLVPSLARDGWTPARLIVPMDHAHAQAVGPDGQVDHLAKVLAEPWWQEHVREYRVLATRIPAEWGAEYHLYRDSMNPVTTAQFMRAGRLAHRSPWLRGLYLAGSATHPGQWVSFCAISGVLAADKLLQDLR